MAHCFTLNQEWVRIIFGCRNIALIRSEQKKANVMDGNGGVLMSFTFVAVPFVHSLIALNILIFKTTDHLFFPMIPNSFVSVCVWNCHDPHPFLDFQNYFKSKKLWCKCMQRVLSNHRVFTYQHIRNKSSTDGFECSVNMHINVLAGNTRTIWWMHA